jgi:hypothetical protein
VLRLGIVGDCSQGDANLLARAIDAALAGSDQVVLVGDVNSSDNQSGYDVVKARLSSGKISVVPGNHDTQGPGDWSKLGALPKQWIKMRGGATLIGLDNSCDAIGPDGWSILGSYDAQPQKPQGPIFVFVHKSLSPLVLPDGTESTHVVSEGAANADADKLKAWIAAREATVCCGHYHGWALLRAPYGDVILEGRGGSQGYAGSKVCGWTQVIVQAEGWTAHPVSLPVS